MYQATIHIKQQYIKQQQYVSNNNNTYQTITICISNNNMYQTTTIHIKQQYVSNNNNTYQTTTTRIKQQYVSNNNNTQTMNSYIHRTHVTEETGMMLSVVR